MSSLVANAADRKQVERAHKKTTRDRDQEQADLRAILALPTGRRVLWRLLEDCKVFASIWHPSALIHFNEGRRDVGLKLMAAISRADDQALLQMMAEAAQLTRRATAEVANDQRIAHESKEEEQEQS